MEEMEAGKQNLRKHDGCITPEMSRIWHECHRRPSKSATYQHTHACTVHIVNQSNNKSETCASCWPHSSMEWIVSNQDIQSVVSSSQRTHEHVQQWSRYLCLLGAPCAGHVVDALHGRKDLLLLLQPESNQGG